ncbi:MAG: TIGR01906 family membrane protein [Dehalococcoidia bacterium]|nr:TIGR01906 family membrane protein [Dehalococcoidia bacterium]
MTAPCDPAIRREPAPRGFRERVYHGCRRRWISYCTAAWRHSATARGAPERATRRLRAPRWRRRYHRRVPFARRAAAALFVVAVPLFLLLSNVRVAALEPRVSEYSFARFDAPARTGIDRAQLDRAAREIARYFTDEEPLLATQVTVAGREEPLFNARELLHMSDVKDLFQLTFRLHEIAFVYIAGYVAAVFLWSRERSLRQLARQCVITGAVTAGVMAAAAAAMLAGFDELFTRFHTLSFANDFWQLDPNTDHLVQMFPQSFWFEVSLAIGALTVLEGGLVALAGWNYLRWLRRPRPPRRPAVAAGQPAETA